MYSLQTPKTHCFTPHEILVLHNDASTCHHWCFHLHMTKKKERNSSLVNKEKVPGSIWLCELKLNMYNQRRLTVLHPLFLHIVPGLIPPSHSLPETIYRQKFTAKIKNKHYTMFEIYSTIPVWEGVSAELLAFHILALIYG